MCYTGVHNFSGGIMTLVSILESHTALVESRWDYSKNGDLGIYPSKVSKGSKVRAWWTCQNHESFDAPVQRVTRAGRDYGCPVCTGTRVLSGYNDLRTTDTALVDDLWAFDLNTEISPGEVSRSSHKKVWWRCTRDHHWESTVANVVRGNRCPYCAGQRAIPGETDMLTTDYDRVMSLWDFDKNSEDPSTISRGRSSNKYFWSCGRHSWEATPAKVIAKGTGCPECVNRRIDPHSNSLAALFPELLVLWDFDRNTDIDPRQISPGSDRKPHWICPKGHRWKAFVYNVALNGHRCRLCSGVGTSKLEDSVATYLLELGIADEEIIRNSRVLGGLEADIWLPNHNLVIECNGVFYHSQYFSDSHRINGTRKRKYALDEGINFFTVWEDDWTARRAVVEKAIAHRLGVGSESVYARKLVTDSVSPEESAKFLEDHHIQGWSRGTIRVGLRDTSGDLKALMVLLRRGDGSLELTRFATSVPVPGGHSKLIKNIENTYDYTYLITFADLGVSSGDLYVKTGWTLDGTIPPDYMYTKGRTRYHKFNYRKKRFRDDPSLKYDPDMTEKELAEMNGLYRVYDYGKMRFVKPHPNTLN